MVDPKKIEGLLRNLTTYTLRQMAGFRNRLVHLYWEIDDELVFTTLQTNLSDFDRFARYIVGFVKNQSP